MLPVRELSVSDVSRARLVSLLLCDQSLGSASEIVAWFGAMQAQDLASGKWSFGVRIPGSTEVDIDGAIERGEVLRTWPMRGTIHFVPPADARWMLELTGVKALEGAAKRREYLGLDLITVDRAASVLESALAGGRRLTRAEAVALLTDSGIPTAGQHGYHLLWYVSQIGVTCIGPNMGKEQTFVLLDDWAPQQRRLDRDEALVELAFRYFRSHGPTSAKDFAGWTGLSMLDAKRAVKKSQVVIELMPFAAMSAKQIRDANQAFKPYGEYLGLPVTVEVSPP